MCFPNAFLLFSTLIKHRKDGSKCKMNHNGFENIGLKRVQTLTQTGNFTRKLVLSSLIRQQDGGWRLEEVWARNIRETSDRGEEKNEEVQPINSAKDVTWLQKCRREQFSLHLWSPVAQNNKFGQK